jgi:hypothetical protein
MQRDRIPKTVKELQTAGKKKQTTTNEDNLGRRGRKGANNGLTPRMFDDDDYDYDECKHCDTTSACKVSGPEIE